MFKIRSPHYYSIMELNYEKIGTIEYNDSTEYVTIAAEGGAAFEFDVVWGAYILDMVDYFINLHKLEGADIERLITEITLFLENIKRVQEIKE